MMFFAFRALGFQRAGDPGEPAASVSLSHFVDVAEDDEGEIDDALGRAGGEGESREEKENYAGALKLSKHFAHFAWTHVITVLVSGEVRSWSEAPAASSPRLRGEVR